MSIAQRLEHVRASIARAAEHAQRNLADITLIAVSKTQPVSAIEDAYAAGQRHFGENYPQELETKVQALAHLPDIVWHMIGRVQRNKIKIVWRDAHVWHTVDRTEIYAALLERSQRMPEERDASMSALQCLVQVNTASDPAKAGFALDALDDVRHVLRDTSRIRVCGAMVIPAAEGDPTPAFVRLRDVARIHHLGRVLSMGMSGDYEKAIACGATLVRVGSAIFGGRKVLDP